jgi:Rieske 2Fe-2S family protein
MEESMREWRKAAAVTVVLAADFAPTRSPLERARHAPPGIYSDPEIFALEKERIFMREWLFVARVEEVENPGDYLALRVLGEPVVLARDPAGTLRAFANVCLHRGVEVACGKGNARAFKCPYHGWVYGLDGSLRGAPLVDDNQCFSKEGRGLREIPLGDWSGNLFINFAREPVPFAEFIAPWQQEYGFLQPERCRLAAKIPVLLECNWKFAVENLLDIYHVRVLHAKSFGAQFDADRKNIRLSPGGVVSYYYRSAAAVPDGRSLFGRMPWIDERGDHFGLTFRMPPNTHMFARCDQIRYLTIWPVAVDRCEITCYHLFPKEHFALPDFEARAQVYRDYQITVLEEDRSMMTSLQRAMTSRNYVPGPMAGIEATIHHVLGDYLDRMGIGGRT